MNKDLSFSISLKFLSIVANAFVVIFLSSELTIEDFGRYSSFLNLYNLALIALTSGGTQLIIREKSQDDIILTGNKVFTLNILIVVTLCSFLSLAAIFNSNYISSREVIILVLSCIFSVASIVIGVKLRASGDIVRGLLFERYLRILLQATIIFTLGYCLAIDFDYNITLYVFIFITALIFLVTFLSVRILKTNFSVPTIKDVRGLFRYTLYSSMVTLFTRVDLIVISVFLGFKSAAVYGLMIQLLNIFTSFEQALNPVFLKRIKPAISGVNFDFIAIHKELRVFTSIILIAGFFGAIFTYFILEAWFLNIWEPSYSDTVNLLLIAIAGRWILSIFGYAENIAMLFGLPENLNLVNLYILAFYIFTCIFAAIWFNLVGVVILQSLAILALRIWRTYRVYTESGYFPSAIYRI